MWIFHGMAERTESISLRTAQKAALTIGLAMGISLVASSVRAQAITACVNNKSGAVSIISKGSCPKNTHAIVLNPPPSTTLTVQKLNIVNGSNKVLASLGPTADGNVLTFFDSGGNKTLTIGDSADETAVGATAWDNNKIISGTGMPRVVWGESNSFNNPTDGLGDAVLDDDGNIRTGFGTSLDLTENSMYAINADGSSEGIGTFKTGFRGYFANDATSPASRQYGGLATNGDSVWGQVDTKGILRVSAVQQVTDELNPANRKGNGFAIWDPNGLQEASMAAFIDGSLVGFNVVDPNNIDRFSVYLTTQNGLNLDTRDQNGTVTGHLP